MKLSIVSPVYKAEEIVDKLIKQITESVSKITDDFEIVLVDDNSTDRSWNKIEENCKKDERIKGIKLSKNFGQHYAITAGLEHSKGDYVVVMDCDLQDNPKYIQTMYEKAKEGYDIVFTKMKKRNHPLLRNIFSKSFSFLYNWLTDSKSFEYSISCFSLLSRKTVDSFCKIRDAQRHYLMILKWLGFKHTYIEVVHEKRYIGKSSYTFLKLFNHAVNGIISQSDKLLKLSIVLGLFLSLLSVLVIAYLISMYFISGFKEGWTSIVVLVLFSTGIVLMFIGILGIYLGKTFEQVKNRPLYLVEEKINI